MDTGRGKVLIIDDDPFSWKMLSDAFQSAHPAYSMFKETPNGHEPSGNGGAFHISKTTKPVDIVIIVEQFFDRKRLTRAGG